MPTLHSKPLIVLLLLVIVSISWILGSVDALPYPYNKIPFGISIGVMTSFIIAGPTFLIWDKVYPNIFLVIFWALIYFTFTGSFKLSLSELHVTTASKQVSLYFGFALGVIFMYWIRYIKIKNISILSKPAKN
jgi:hypothetical protein